MSTVQNTHPVWPSLANEAVDSKYEKCRHITEEIYKRINITFQIKSLETGSLSDVSIGSDQIEIDSNELSNGTDLFAYEKSDSISSSTDQDETKRDKLINLNNNEIKKSIVPIYKPPRKRTGDKAVTSVFVPKALDAMPIYTFSTEANDKRFRKKIKKRQCRTKRDSGGSSDEAPLSRIVEPRSVKLEEDSLESTDVMGVPKIAIVCSAAAENKEINKESKSKPKQTEEPAAKTEKPPAGTVAQKSETIAPVDFSLKECTVELTNTDISGVSKIAKSSAVSTKEVAQSGDWRKCDQCDLPCRGERGLRRHMALSHILIPESLTRPKTRKSADEKIF